MSRFLKIIVNLVVIAAIAVAAALLVPPFLGVYTVMNDNTETETNLPVGSVAYGQSTSANDLEVGDRIIYSEGSSDYIYEITDMDASAAAYRVRDPYDSNSDEENITIQGSVPRVAIVVPFIGYGAIALQSTEGLIVVGLGIVFLIILFILSEIWRKDRDEDEDEEEEDFQDEDESEDEEEEIVLSRRERRRLKKEEKRRRKMERKGILEEDDEEEETEEEISEEQDSEETASRESFSQGEDLEKAVEEAMSSVAAGVSNISEPEQVPDATMVMPDMSSFDQESISDEIQEEEEIEAAEAMETADEIGTAEGSEIEETGTEEEDISLSEETESSEEAAEEEPEEEKVFNPESVPNTPTVEELLAKAQAAGDAPEVKEDKDNQVTLLDYSDIL